VPSPAFVSGSNNHTTGTSVSVTAPASIVAGNLLVAFMWGFGTTNTFTLDSGWTSAFQHNASTNEGATCVATKVATGSEPASYTFGLTGSGSGFNVSILQFSGASGLDGSVALNAMVTNTSTPSAPSVTPTKTPDTLVCCFGSAQPSTVSTPAGMTAGPNGIQSGYNNNYTFYEYISGTSPTGSQSATWSMGPGSGLSFLIAPPNAVTGTALVAVGPLLVAGSATPVGGCGRQAWLELDGESLAFQDETGGWFCTSLDIAFPAVREIMTSRPDNTGMTDRTQYFGSRVITAQIEALTGAGAQIDAVAARFAPFMDPARRPQLFYVLDRPGQPQRTLTVRPAGFSWPIQGPYQRSIQLQFVAADPVAYDPTVQTATCGPGAPATITTAGVLAVRPLITVTGPVTGPTVTITPASGTAWVLAFLSTYTIPAGHHVDIDTDNRTVVYDSNPAQPRLSSLDWTRTSWQAIPAATTATITLTGTATSGATQARASWQDGYLT